MADWRSPQLHEGIDLLQFYLKRRLRFDRITSKGSIAVDYLLGGLSTGFDPFCF